jgi:hypothetical protein
MLRGRLGGSGADSGIAMRAQVLTAARRPLHLAIESSQE